MFENLFRNKFGHNLVFFAEGDGDGGGGGESWQSEHQFFTENPEAAKSSAKYKTIDAYFKGSQEAMTKTGRPFWLPENHDKLTGDQKNEILDNVAVMQGVPKTSDGYVLNIPEGTNIDVQAVADFKAFAHENKMPQSVFEGAVNQQIAMMDRVNKGIKDAREAMTKENFQALSKSLKGDKPAIAAMEQIKNLLQSKCKDDKGNPDPVKWEQFKARMFFEDKMVEGVLAEALLEPARAFSEGGGAGGGGSPAEKATGSLSYKEMD